MENGSDSTHLRCRREHLTKTLGSPGHPSEGKVGPMGRPSQLARNPRQSIIRRPRLKYTRGTRQADPYVTATILTYLFTGRDCNVKRIASGLGHCGVSVRTTRQLFIVEVVIQESTKPFGRAGYLGGGSGCGDEGRGGGVVRRAAFSNNYLLLVR